MINTSNNIMATGTTSQMSSITSMGRKTVTINGQTYPVVKVPDNDPMKSTFAQSYKEVVIIDGQQYDVETVSDQLACDKNKEVVVVDGQQYDVNNGNNLNLGGVFSFNENARINEDSTIAYTA